MPHKWRVLIADDHAIVRQGLKLLIDSQSDMEVVGEAADGAAVLEQASVVRPDVVIMDISMPRMNGFEVLAWVRAQPEWHCLPVIMLSSSALDQDVQRAYELNANTYLTKPATFSQLAKALEQLCQYWFLSSQLPHCGPDAISMSPSSH